MKTSGWAMLAGLWAGGAAWGASGPARTEGLNAFADAVYAKLAAEARGQNLIFSPYSIHAAMGMTASGAKGETERQLARLLGAAATADARNRAAKELMDSLAAAQKGGDITLEVANRVWSQKNFRVLEDFQAGLKSAYDSAMMPADFRGDAEGVRGEINGWVSDRTRKKIPELISPGVLNAMTRMVLVNAIYFYGGWEREFNRERTKDAPFFLADGSQHTAPLMAAKFESLRYAERDGIRIAELPYKGGRLAMLVVLPQAGGFAAAEQLVAKEGLGACAKSLQAREVEVWLPRFRAEGQFGLSPALAAMGAPDAFDAGRADFSGITGGRDLFISDVIHQAVIEVNEKGTEAAAATAVVMRTTAMRNPQPPVQFRADRPFLYAIRDRQSGAVLFAGRLMKP